MKVTFAREVFDINDDEGLVSATRSRAINVVKMIPNKLKNEVMEQLLASIMYAFIKAGAVLAIHEVRKAETVPLDQYRQLVDYLRELAGEGKPQAVVVDESTEETTDGEAESEGVDEGAGAAADGAAEPAADGDNDGVREP